MFGATDETAPFHGRRIAVVHEWIAGRAGSEQVFEAIAGVLPSADLYALTAAPEVHLDVGERSITTSFLDRPALRDRRAVTLPLMPMAWNVLSDRDYDVVVSSAHAFARWFRPARAAEHFSYVHAPLRYVWTPDIDLRGRRVVGQITAPLFKYLDLRTIRWTDHFAANSREVARRIGDFYGREATVIVPPVGVKRNDMAGPGQREGLLAFGRWIEYKRFDLAIAAAALSDEPLTIAGNGPFASQIRTWAGDARIPVEIVENPTDEMVAKLYATHRALLFPGREDFGLVLVEAAAAGLPAIAFAAGGAFDIIVDGKTGLLVHEQSPNAFAEAIKRSRRIEWSEDVCRNHALAFSLEEFRRRITCWLETPTEALSRSRETTLW